MLVRTVDVIERAQLGLSQDETRDAAESLLSLASLHLKHEVIDLTPRQEKWWRVLNQSRG